MSRLEGGTERARVRTGAGSSGSGSTTSPERSGGNNDFIHSENVQKNIFKIYDSLRAISVEQGRRRDVSKFVGNDAEVRRK